MSGMIGINGIRSRLASIESLAQALGKETERVQDGAAVSQLTPEERHDYLHALLDAISGLDAAHAALIWAVERLDREVATQA